MAVPQRDVLMESRVVHGSWHRHRGVKRRLHHSASQHLHHNSKGKALVLLATAGTQPCCRDVSTHSRAKRHACSDSVVSTTTTWAPQERTYPLLDINVVQALQQLLTLRHQLLQQ